MSFYHFRFIVTILACFAPFFAYICRLNLSLTIDQMVVKEEPYVARISSQGLQIVDELTASGPAPLFQTEEHTLARISSPSIRRYIWRHASTNNVPMISEKKSAIASARRSSSSSLSPLSVEFDSNPGTNGNRTTRTGALGPVNSTGEGLPSNEQPDIIEPSTAPNLLNWSMEERNDLLGAFFIGYLIFQIPGARAAEMFGAKSLFVITGLGSGLCSLLFPLAAKSSSSIIYAYMIRVIMGASQGAMFPASYVLLCEWLPKSERSQWLAIPSSMSRVGTIVMNILVPVIILNYNWEMVFYLSGAVNLVWCLVFMLFGSNSPTQSYWLTKNELIYIESHMEPRVGTLNQQPNCITASGYSINESANKDTHQLQHLASPQVSWKRMCTNKAILILSLAMFMSEWSNMLLLIKLPGFLGPVLKMELTEIGFWSSVFIGIFCVHCPLSGFIASKLEVAQIECLDTLRVRKIFEIAAHTFQGTGCLIIAFSTDKVVILSALSLMMFGRATVGGGQCLMPPELSKEYPGTVFAFANTIANTAGVFGPMTVNWLVRDPCDHGSWFNLWLLSGLLFLTGGIVFCLFADNRTQNYCRKPKAMGPGKSTSEAQLTTDKNPSSAHQIFRMAAFGPSLVSGNPDPEPQINGHNGNAGRPITVRRGLN